MALTLAGAFLKGTASLNLVKRWEIHHNSKGDVKSVRSAYCVRKSIPPAILSFCVFLFAYFGKMETKALTGTRTGATFLILSFLSVVCFIGIYILDSKVSDLRFLRDVNRLAKLILHAGIADDNQLTKWSEHAMIQQAYYVLEEEERHGCHSIEAVRQRDIMRGKYRTLSKFGLGSQKWDFYFEKASDPNYWQVGQQTSPPA